MATMSWESNRNTMTQATKVHARTQGLLTGEAIETLRVTLAVLSMQIVFRAMLLLRRWNY